jgi:hypothetical protein
MVEERTKPSKGKMSQGLVLELEFYVEDLEDYITFCMRKTISCTIF